MVPNTTPQIWKYGIKIHIVTKADIDEIAVIFVNGLISVPPNIKLEMAKIWFVNKHNKRAFRQGSK